MHKLTWIISAAVGLVMVHQLGSEVLAQSGGPDMRVEQLLRKLEQLAGPQRTATREKARRKGKLRKKFAVKNTSGSQCPHEARLSANHFGAGESYFFSSARPIDLSGGSGSAVVVLPYDLRNAETTGDFFITARVFPNCTNSSGGPLNLPNAEFQQSFSIPLPENGTTTNLDDSIITLSDVRLKRDIAPVGRLANGLKLYRYRYLWDGTEYVGVMAQEVAEVMPEAVVRGADGFLRVDYAKLGTRLMTFDAWSSRRASVAKAQ